VRPDVRPPDSRSGVERPLLTLLQAAGSTAPVVGPGPTVTADELTADTVVAAEQILRTVRRLDQSQDRLTEALVESHDRMAALRALIAVPVNSLDHTEALTAMLTEALELTDSDSAVLITAVDFLIVGDDEVGSALRRSMVPPELLGREPLPIELPGGAAVVAALPDGQGWATLGLARTGVRQYSTGDLELVDAVVAATDKLLTLTRTYQRDVARASIEREHQLASTLAQAVLPSQPPQLDGLETFATVIPAGVSGGDFIVFTERDGVLWFAVGDVAGKGLPAAVVMTKAVSAARVAFHRHHEHDPAAALDAVVDELHDYLSDTGLFVTLIVGAHRPGSGIATLCNAGHSPVLTVRDGAVQAIPPSLPPVGVIRGRTGRNHCVPLTRGDVLVLGSDGLSEQQNPAGELFGYQRFEQAMLQRYELPLAELGRSVLDEVTEFAAGTAPSDDRTLVLLRAAS
jgi:serine phosphatase RsbU (regulator of sigma subunit)